MITSTAPFKPGQAVYYLPYIGLNKPPITEPAIVLRTTEKRVRILLTSGRESSVSADYICYCGYCAVCQLPAVDNAGQLLCPQCGAAAVAAIPPDRILFDQLGELPTMARKVRGVLNGEVTTLADCSLLNSDYAAWVKMLKQTKLYYSWSTDCEVWSTFRTGRMRDLAIIGDEAGFIAEYRRLAAEHGVKDAIVQYEKIEKALDLFDKLLQAVEAGEYDDLIEEFESGTRGSLPRRPSRPVMLDLPDAPERSADDAEPSGADDITRWLDGQFGGNTPAAE
jgi:hypothetical protein